MNSRTKAGRERRIEQIAIEIERLGGDSDDHAALYLRATIAQSPRQGEQTMRALADEIDAWRRARRVYRRCFANLAPSKT